MQHSNNSSEYNEAIREWKDKVISKALINKLKDERLNSMEAVLSAPSEKVDIIRGIALGITQVLNLIQNMEEGDISAYIGD